MKKDGQDRFALYLEWDTYLGHKNKEEAFKNAMKGLKPSLFPSRPPRQVLKNIFSFESMIPCETCGKGFSKLWINPSNPANRGWYCEEHYLAISKGFQSFKELMLLVNSGAL